MSKVQCICQSCGQVIRAAKSKPVMIARTAAEILTPVARRKIGRDRVHVIVESLFTDGEIIRLTIARNPKDSDELAVEVGRRLAILFRARTAIPDWSALAWYTINGRLVQSWTAEMIERAASQLIECRAVAPESMFAIAAE